MMPHIQVRDLHWYRTPPGQPTAEQILRPGLLLHIDYRGQTNNPVQVLHVWSDIVCRCCTQVNWSTNPRWCPNRANHQPDDLFSVVCITFGSPNAQSDNKGLFRESQIEGYLNYIVAVDGKLRHLYRDDFYAIVGETATNIQLGFAL